MRGRGSRHWRRSNAVRALPVPAFRFCPAAPTWTVFIMPASPRSRRSPDMPIRLLAALLLTLTLLPAPRADAANFSVKSVQSTLDNRVLHVNARFDLPVNPRIEGALSKGIPIDVGIDVGRGEKRWGV